ncbi:unnamed protein product, partial [Rotaria sp. Silwood1]
MNQLNEPSDVIIDRSTDTLLICDSGNERVMRWPRRGRIRGDIVLYGTACYGLAMDDRGFLY